MNVLFDSPLGALLRGPGSTPRACSACAGTCPCRGSGRPRTPPARTWHGFATRWAARAVQLLVGVSAASPAGPERPAGRAGPGGARGVGGGAVRPACERRSTPARRPPPHRDSAPDDAGRVLSALVPASSGGG